MRTSGTVTTWLVSTGSWMSPRDKTSARAWRTSSATRCWRWLGPAVGLGRRGIGKVGAAKPTLISELGRGRNPETPNRARHLRGRVPHLPISRLLRRERGEGAAVGLQVEERRAVEAVEAAHQDGRALHADEPHQRGADRVRAHGRAQREGAARRAVALRALPDEVAAGLVQPVEHLQ